MNRVRCVIYSLFSESVMASEFGFFLENIREKTASQQKAQGERNGRVKDVIGYKTISQEALLCLSSKNGKRRAQTHIYQDMAINLNLWCKSPSGLMS